MIRRLIWPVPFVQHVAYQFCRYCAQPAAIPLGRFHTEFAASGARNVPSPILVMSPRQQV